MIHAVKCAGTYSQKENESVASVAIAGPYCKAPKLTTGAGDHFNSGFSCGLLAGLKPVDALYLGVATSETYVRKAGSPSAKEVTSLLEAWGSGQDVDGLF